MCFVLFLILVLIVAGVIAATLVAKENEKKRQKQLEMEQLERQRQLQETERIERERKAKEQARQQAIDALKSEYKSVLDELSMLAYKAVNDDGFITATEPKYQKFLSCRQKAMSQQNSMQIWQAEYRTFLNDLNTVIKRSITHIASHPDLNNGSIQIEIMRIESRLKLLKLISNSKAYDNVITELKDFRSCIATFRFAYLESVDDEYGNFSFPTDNEDKIINPKELASTSDISISDLNRIESHFKKLEQMGKKSELDINIYKELSELLNSKDYIDSVIAAWGFAVMKPFNVSLFETACSMISWYANFNGIQPLEVMAVRIYNWNSIGGTNVVKEYRRDILNWVDNVYAFYYEVSGCEEVCSKLFYNFASYLAWMELYDIEFEVLKRLVELKVQLTEAAQERLNFLSTGGTTNIQIYTPKKDAFSFDSSTLDWKDNQINLLFRKLKMKNISLEYSLLRKNWMKTYPLQNGQEYNADALYNEFETMIEDFDGEVTLTRENAVALNALNISYPGAMIFHFKSERNRCISMLFYAEKFGRNLNITILTLFTPEKNLSAEELESYAVAIKNNVYTDSFQESILEVLDHILKIETQAYDDSAVNDNSEDNFSGFFD